MSNHSGFVDLRVGHSAQGVGDESVWPSFTDIMTVIVMIFMMTLVVILIRNSELDNQLISSISEKEATNEVNKNQAQRIRNLETSLGMTTIERDELQANLTKELNRVSQLTAEQLRLQTNLSNLIQVRKELAQENTQLNQAQLIAKAQLEKVTQSEQQLSDQVSTISQQLNTLKLSSETEILALTEDKDSLNAKYDRLNSQMEQVRQLLEQTNLTNSDLNLKITEFEEVRRKTQQKLSLAAEEILALKVLVAQKETEKAILENQKNNTNQEVETLAQLIKLRESENEDLRNQVANSLTTYNSLRKEYEALDSRYKDLIRPARNTAGKYVVRIVLAKNGEDIQYQLKLPTDDKLTVMTKQALYQTLKEQQNRIGKQLYTKIVIPENSALSHNEAWQLTQDILEKFDYYYQ